MPTIPPDSLSGNLWERNAAFHNLPPGTGPEAIRRALFGGTVEDFEADRLRRTHEALLAGRSAASTVSTATSQPVMSIKDMHAAIKKTMDDFHETFPALEQLKKRIQETAGNVQAFHHAILEASPPPAQDVFTMRMRYGCEIIRPKNAAVICFVDGDTTSPPRLRKWQRKAKRRAMLLRVRKAARL